LGDGWTIGRGSARQAQQGQLAKAGGVAAPAPCECLAGPL